MVDPVTVSIVGLRLEAIVREMGEALLRTSYSQILNSSRDFSTAVCDARGRLVAQAEHIPIHVGAIPFAVEAVRDFFGAAVRPGDLFLLNDPYHGGNHLPDLTALLPVFAGEELVFWSVSRAHQSDIGGATHGSYNAAATEIWQEGLRITPLKLYDAGALREDVLHFVATNVRHSRDFLGDLRAMMGAARVGERRLLRLVADYGLATLNAAVDEVLDSAERRARAIIAEWRDGVYRGEAILDDDGHGIEDIHLRATVTKQGDGLLVDLSECDPQVIGFVNSSYPNSVSAVRMALAFLLDPDIPRNDGTFRPLEVRLKQGTLVWPNPPAPVTLATSIPSAQIAECVMKALADACPRRVVAGWTRRFRIAIRGTDPRNGRSFIWHMFHARGGSGATAYGDGWEGGGDGESVGGIKFASVEVTETRFPLFLRHHEFRADSAGDGLHRGGVGARLELVVETVEPAAANTAGDGARHRPYGLFGGEPGRPHRYRLVGKGRNRTLKTKEILVPIQPGDTFVVESSGGGGYGDPARRAAEARAADLANGFVSAGDATAGGR